MTTIDHNSNELICYAAVILFGLYISIVFAPMAAIPAIPCMLAVRREFRRE